MVLLTFTHPQYPSVGSSQPCVCLRDSVGCGQITARIRRLHFSLSSSFDLIPASSKCSISATLSFGKEMPGTDKSTNKLINTWFSEVPSIPRIVSHSDSLFIQFHRNTYTNSFVMIPHYYSTNRPCSRPECLNSTRTVRMCRIRGPFAAIKAALTVPVQMAPPY